MDIWKARKRSDRYCLLRIAYNVLGIIGGVGIFLVCFFVTDFHTENFGVAICGLMCWLSVIGSNHYELLEIRSIRLEREEARRVMKNRAS